MNISEFISQMKERRPGATEKELAEFEAVIGCRLPEDFRQFLATTNGGSVEHDKFFSGTEEVGICIVGIGGIPDLIENRDCYQVSEQRIPRELLWIGDDAFSRAVCIGLGDKYRGKVYLWDSDHEPGSAWNGKVETAGNIDWLANSFAEFITSLRPPPEPPKKALGCASVVAIAALASIVLIFIVA
jgi:SMI1/KNR4 family protein SUKH-1